MTPLLIPLLLTAAGGIALVVASDARLAIAGLGLQWLGVIWAAVELASAGSRILVGLSRGGAVEAVTAVVSLAIILLTLRNLNYARTSQGRQGLSDYLLPVTAALLGGIAGLGLSSIFPLTTVSQADLVFYWAALAGGLVLVLDGSSNPVKLTAGLLALFNAVVLLLLTTGPRPPSALLLGVIAIVQIVLAGVLSYGWGLLTLAFGAVSLEPLFDARDMSTSTELVVVSPPVGDEPAAASETNDGLEPAEAQVEDAEGPAPPRAAAPPPEPGRNHRRSGKQTRRGRRAAEGQASK